MIYEYRNKETGEVREIHARVADRPPETIAFNDDGSWKQGDGWARVYGCAGGCVKLSGETTYKTAGPPVSMSMPWDKREGEVVNRNGHRVRQHKDGTFSTMEGARIIDSKESRRKHMEQCGYVEW